MKEVKRGKAWKFGHDLDADIHIYPMIWQIVATEKGFSLDLARHVKESVILNSVTRLERVISSLLEEILPLENRMG